MTRVSLPLATAPWPKPAAVLELLKPITWFAPMWAFMCGVVSAGASFSESIGPALLGAVLAGPLVCATSQAVNDWFDRHVDAINEPMRPIPSGRIPGSWGLWIAIAGTVISLLYSVLLGPAVLAAAIVGLALAWAYSAPPFRLKMSGLWGPLAVGICYEGLAWFTGAAVIAGGWPPLESILLAALYSIGAHGIMTLNDFKAIEGDARLGIRSLPVMLGVRRAALVACVVMAVPQAVVVLFLLSKGATIAAALVALALAMQVALMPRLISDPRAYAPWYNATGVLLFVLGMLASALALNGWLGGGA